MKTRYKYLFDHFGCSGILETAIKTENFYSGTQRCLTKAGVPLRKLS